MTEVRVAPHDDLGAGRLGERLGPDDEVLLAVGLQDVADRQPLGPRRGEDLLEISSGVDDDRLARLAVADEVADAGDAGCLEAFEACAVLPGAIEFIPPTV